MRYITEKASQCVYDMCLRKVARQPGGNPADMGIKFNYLESFKM